MLRLVKYPVTLKRNKKHYIIQYIVTNVTLLHLLRLFFSKKIFFKFLPYIVGTRNSVTAFEEDVIVNRLLAIEKEARTVIRAS